MRKIPHVVKLFHLWNPILWGVVEAVVVTGFPSFLASFTAIIRRNAGRGFGVGVAVSRADSVVGRDVGQLSRAAALRPEEALVTAQGLAPEQAHKEGTVEAFLLSLFSLGIPGLFPVVTLIKAKNMMQEGLCFRRCL